MKRRLALAFIAMIAFSVGRGERRGNQDIVIAGNKLDGR